MDKKEGVELLCTVKELEEHWNVTPSKTNNNVRSRYLNSPKKRHQVEIMDIGIFCKKNDITPSMLSMGIRHIKEVASLFTNQEIKDKNKVVIMSEQDYDEYQKFKSYQEFNNKADKK